MSRKDYTAIALAIYYNLEDGSARTENLIRELCIYFEATNPAFNAEKFIKACNGNLND